MDIKQCKEIYEMLKKSKQFIANIDKDFFLSFAETVLAELEKKEAIITEMSNFINLMGNELVAETGNNNLEFCKRQKCIDNEELDCEECIKEHFTNKVEQK